MRQILISLLLPALALAVPAASMSSTAMSKTSSMASMSKTSMTAATMMTKAVSTSSMSKSMSTAKTSSMTSKASMTSKTTSMMMMSKTSTRTSMMAMPTVMNLNTMLGNKCARMTVLQIIILIIIPSNTGTMPMTQQTAMKNMTTMATNKLNMMMANSTFAMQCQCKQIPMLQKWTTMMNNPANVAIIVNEIIIRLPTMVRPMAKPMTTIVITNIVVIINNMLNTMMRNTNLMNFCNMKATTPNNGTVLVPTTSVKPVTTATATSKPAMVTTNAAVRAMEAMGPGAFAGIFMVASFFFF